MHDRTDPSTLPRDEDARALPRLHRADLAAPSSSARLALRRAAETGAAFCVEAVIDPALVRAALDASAAFFARPLEEKLALSAERAGGIRGYRPLPDGAGDLKEWFFFTNGLPEDTVNASALPGRNLWPAGLPGFREAVTECALAMHEAGASTLRALAQAIDLPAETWDVFSGGGLRVLRYPPLHERRLPEQWGAAEHTDMTPFALIADDSPGLSCKSEDGAWVDAAPEPGSLLCQSGDLLARWTGDAICPAPHRVALSPARARISLCYFMLPLLDAVIPCLPTSLAHRPTRSYTPITFGDYMASHAAAVTSADAAQAG
jgi:isopenicillin N synthase-like dioxygenase